MNSKVINRLSKLFISFSQYIRSDEVRNHIGKCTQDFTRVFKFPWYDVLYYLIFRTEKCVPSELTKYYSGISKGGLRISRQAAFKAIKKVNPNIFHLLIDKFSELFYKSNLVKTYKGYIVLAADGTTANLIATDQSLEKYGFNQCHHIKTKEDAKKAISRSMALYDVTNGLIVDFDMAQYKDSEIPLTIKQLENSHHYFSHHKALYLADRYFGSVELFSILEKYDMKYCIRAKPNFFKDLINKMKSNDEWITVTLNKAWLKRLKYDIAKDRFYNDPTIKIRVVKFNYQYSDKNNNLINAELRYFTNLSEEEFSTEDIISLYAKRWDIECSYKTLKTDYEWERYFSKDCDSETCSILSKVIFHNINVIIRKELNLTLEESKVKDDNKYTYTTNIVQLSRLLHENLLYRFMRNKNMSAIKKIIQLTLDLINKIKVPIRPNRHFKRWGRHTTTSNPMRFRIDGRNWPNAVYTNGYMQTKHPA